MPMPKLMDLTGQRFGRWTVIDRAPDRRRGYPEWNCVCDCGGRGAVRANILRTGQSRSCGCLNREDKRRVCLARNTTHGMSKTPTYDTWQNMITRCHNPAATAYYKYGAKGVTVCDRWRESFEAFLADVGTRPGRAHTIDRIDNARGYEPGNCHWATMKAQQNNRTNNHRLTLGSETLTVAQWAARIGRCTTTIRNRLALGWPMEKVLSPARHGRSHRALS